MPIAAAYYLIVHYHNWMAWGDLGFLSTRVHVTLPMNLPQPQSQKFLV